jgi:hypothetical protein
MSRSITVAEVESEAAGKRAPEERVILKSADLSIKVDNPDSCAKKIADVATNYHGYSITSGNTYLQIRVPAEQLDSAISDIAKLGLVTGKNISGKDVTDEYYDSKIRLENKEKARQRYLELLAKAENVEATLKVEKELERLNGEIESLKGAIARIEKEAQFSLISVSLEKKEKLGPVGFVFYWTFRGIAWLFVRE